MPSSSRRSPTFSVARASFVVILLILTMGRVGIPVLAHDDPNAPVPALRALKVDAPLKVDGILDEPFWSQTEVGGGFIDLRTHQPAAQKTAVRVAYTRTHLYIAAECFDDQMDKIRASERREDRDFAGDDWVEVHLDPAHTHISKYAFFSNPLGTRSDANEGPSGMFNRGWTAEWDLAAKIEKDRWVFEMSIPWSIMNYERKDGQIWGINFTRAVRHADSTSFWSFNPTDTYKPRHFGHLTGLDLADAKLDHNLEVTPYFSTRVDFNHRTKTTFKTGMDVSVRLTPSIISAWTLYPDFGQVEADDDTIELRDTERFLPEKRLFFREGDELLRMSHSLYYSRRFTDIIGGGKVSGQYKGYNFAFLNLYGDVTHGGTREGNSTVLRVMHNVRQKSNVGFFVSDAELPPGHSRVLSTDGYFHLTDAWRFRYQLSGAQEYGPQLGDRSLKDRQAFLGYSALIYDLYPWEFSLGYNAISEDFNPALGFIPRRDIYGPFFLAQYERTSGKDWYKGYSLGYYNQFYLNAHQATRIHDHEVYGRLHFINDLALRLGHEEDYHAPFHNRHTFSRLSLFTSDYWRSIAVGHGIGRFEETRYNEINLEKNFKFIERWPIRYEFDIRFEDRPDDTEAIVWLNRIVFDYFFTNKMWLKSSLQHRSSDIHNISLIYGWEFRRKTFWYVVFNNVSDGQETGNSIFTKIVYTF